MKIPANGFTHGGKFHADDVFATALLQILRPDIKITRGFEVPENFEGIVYDIGFGMFDHHQEPRETRANGVPYAAFGLLWRVLGPGLVGERQARLIDENFIQPLDLNDNTGEQDSLADAIGSFNPRWDSKEPADECFARAVAFAKEFARKTGAVVAITGAIDLVADGERAYCIRSGHPMMSSITGTGCQLSAMTAAYLTANPTQPLEATAAAVCAMGLAGEIAHRRLTPMDGNATYRNYIIDAIYHLTPEELEKGANYEVR